MQLYWLMLLMQVEEEDLLGQKIVETSRRVCADLAEAWQGRCCYETFLNKLNEAVIGVASMADVAGVCDGVWLCGVWSRLLQK
ncbi:hypothetical protein S7335_4086 [Synechococcus sp. PCC 7335]|uniref:hypothetical protein n=1 Tax=Synechococcus sp. (strain ATCC 29403 / PCC 7335) TaxID=91464 RepID=UPI00017EB114|nr:hypothetical protein [Synechococcus sp. PCC 7335]EDX86382.1 hypothetical protein S7335_4086 [Synechococcus sp. PCC 7335]